MESAAEIAGGCIIIVEDGGNTLVLTSVSFCRGTSSKSLNGA